MGFVSKRTSLLLIPIFIFLFFSSEPAWGKVKHSAPVRGEWVVRFAKNSFFSRKPFQFSSPAISENALFAGVDKNKFYAVDLRKGKKLWNYSTLGAIHAKPAVAVGNVYFGDAKGNIYALEQKTGKRVWNAQVDGAVMSAPLVLEKQIIFVTLSKQVKSFDLSTGKELWQTLPLNRDSGFTVLGSSDPFFSAGSVWVGFSDGTLLAYAPDSGQLQGVYQLGNINERLHDVDATGLVAGNNLYIPTADGHLFALDISKRKILWEIPIGDVTDPIIENGKIYLTAGNTVYCLEEASGATIWEQELEAPGLSSPASLGSWIVVMATKGKMHFLDRTTGDVYFSRHLRGGGSYSDPVVAENRMFLLTNSARLYSFRLKKKK